MPDGDMPENGRNKRKKAVYAKINFWSLTVLMSAAVAGSLLTIISEFTQIPLDVHFVCVLIVGSVELLSFIPMAFSFFKLRSSEKTKKNDSEEISASEGEFRFFKSMPVSEFERLQSALENDGIKAVCSGGEPRAAAGKDDNVNVFVRNEDFEKVKGLYETLSSQS